MTAALDFLVPLFVPGNRPDRFEQAAVAGADAIILDLEDAVPADAKHEARTALRGDFTSLPILVRVNGIGTRWHDADMAAIAGQDFAAVVIPKAEGIEAIRRGFAPSEAEIAWAGKVLAEVSRFAPDFGNFHLL